MSFFLDAITLVGGTTALVGSAAYISKALVQHWLSKYLEDYKLQLQTEVESHKAALMLENSKVLDSAKFEFEKELILRRGEVDIVKEGYKFASESEKQRNDRLRAQIQRWALPIQGAIEDLSYRLNDILTDDGYVMLSSSSKPVDGWSANYDYFMPSTLYYFAQYFCWTRLLQQQLGHELFRSTHEMSSFFERMNEASSSISRFPYDQEYGDDAALKDRQVFKLQQRAIGELLISNSTTGESIVSYREFLDRWINKEDSLFIRHIAPLELFLRDLSPNQDNRWTRLHELSRCLKEFKQACQLVLKPTVVDD